VTGLRLRSMGFALVALAVGAVGCSSSKNAISVTSTNTACAPARTTFAAGKLTFKVLNRGNKPTELYVYATNDKIIGEVENVGPGTRRELTVDLGEGRYELACKPGQTGDGIRAPITVTGSGGSGNASTAAGRDVEVTAKDYSFDLPDPKIKVSETIRFELKNRGGEDHELEVSGPDGKVLGKTDTIKSGKTGDVTITFAKAGTYRYICDVDDHLERGMKGTFTVS
jgi:plastocyanin